MALVNRELAQSRVRRREAACEDILFFSGTSLEWLISASQTI
jgi:hypothetical protein